MIMTISGVVAVFVPAYLIAQWVSRKSAFYKPLISTAAGRYASLDGLRGYLALGVMLHHVACNYSYYQNHEWLPLMSPVFDRAGPVAVGQFFLITGFLFWGKAIDRKLDVVAFFKSRAWRLGPLYLATVLGVLLIAWGISGFSYHESTAVTLKEILRISTLGLMNFNPFNAIDFTRINAGVTWTLQYEWLFYLALPLLAIFATTRRFFVIPALATLLMIVPIAKLPGLGSVVWLFVGGMFVAHLVRWFPKLPALKSAGISYLVVITLFAVVCCIRFTIPNALLSTLVFIPFVYGNTMFGILTSPASRLLGTISYSLYLCHGFFLFAMHVILQRTVGFSGPPITTYWLSLAITAAATVTGCLFTYRWLEHPFLRSSSKAAPRIPPAPVPVLVPTAEPALEAISL